MAAELRSEPGEFELPNRTRPDSTTAQAFAYQYLKEHILNLTLPPGSLVTETNVVEAIGLSRTPIREAFLRLEGEDLVTLQSRRGALVSTISLREILEFTELRFLLEGYAVETICHREYDVADPLENLVRRQRQLQEQGAKIEDLIVCDRAFHQTLVGSSGNTEVSKTYAALGDKQQRIGVASFTAHSQRMQNAIAHHAEIVEALRSFDTSSARDTLRVHLDDSTKQLERFFST